MDDDGKLASIAEKLANRTEETKIDAPAPRRKRVPVGQASARLAAPERLGYVRRFVNDSPGRIATLQNAGYEIVSDDMIPTEGTGSQIERTADRATGMKTILMETKQEFYDEDKAAKAAAIARTDQAIREGTLDGTPGVEGRYVGEISIEAK
jgi:hypothetical protein|tara:strand:- start:6203 stop:6658 length:456 start_codon:yes stop_codon:yes gene_type:complete